MATAIQDILPPLECGSDGEERDAAVEMQNMKDGRCSDDDDDDDAGDDWNEMDQDSEPTQCLFCDHVADSIESAVLHLTAGHGFDLNAVKEKFNMDQYSYIKMVNYIRTHSSDANTIMALIDQPSNQPWMDDQYLKPVQIEPWLMFDIEEVGTIRTGDVATGSAPKCEAHQIEDLQRQVEEKDGIIEHLFHQIEQMKLTFHDLIERTDTNAKSSVASVPQPSVGRVPIDDDDRAYFSTYSHYDIHHDMLSDRVRTDSYRDAILRNRALFANKTVLDVGCGTSILSMFASQAGAERIVAVDQSEIIYFAMDIVNRNQVKNIHFVKGRLEDTAIPVPDKVDIIISEWMGYFLLFEGMLDSVIYARDHHLKENGIILPNRCNISLVAFGDEQRHREFISFWEDVYGFDMTTLQPEVLKEAIVEECKNEHVLSDPVVIAEFNMMTADYSCPNFSFDFQMAIHKEGKLTAFVGYFDTFFDLPEAISFSTGPQTTPTHWKQVVFYIRRPISVATGEVVQGKFFCRRGLKDFRSLCIQIQAFGETFSYSLA